MVEVEPILPKPKGPSRFDLSYHRDQSISFSAWGRCSGGVDRSAGNELTQLQGTLQIG